MAKGKHATALFEVIHSSRKPPKASSSGGIPTPKWWFKNRKKPTGDNGGMLSKLPIFSAKEEVAPESPPRVIERIVEKPVYIERPAPMRIAGDVPMGLDKANHQISFRLSYAGVIAAGFVIVVIVAIAYLAGTRATQVGLGDEYRPAPTATVDPGTTPGGGSGFLAAVTPATIDSSVMDIKHPTAIPTVDAKAAASDSAPSAPGPTTSVGAFPGKVTRQVGLHYVIAQSYPDAEIAKKACAFLNNAGIACTIEKGPPGWAMKSWFSVVGVKSFDHIQRNPELETYKQAIEDAGTKFAGAKSFNRFEPKLYKWRVDPGE